LDNIIDNVAHCKITPFRKQRRALRCISISNFIKVILDDSNSNPKGEDPRAVRAKRVSGC